MPETSSFVSRSGADRCPGVLRLAEAHPDLVDAADLVVEMTKIKRPMDAGQKGQRGIEW